MITSFAQSLVLLSHLGVWGDTHFTGLWLKFFVAPGSELILPVIIVLLQYHLVVGLHPGSYHESFCVLCTVENSRLKRNRTRPRKCLWHGYEYAPTLGMNLLLEVEFAIQISFLSVYLISASSSSCMFLLILISVVLPNMHPITTYVLPECNVCFLICSVGESSDFVIHGWERVLGLQDGPPAGVQGSS